MAQYYLVEKRTDNIVDKIDSVTSGGAEHYFIGRKKMKDNEKAFHELWKVVKKKDYDREFKNNLYNVNSVCLKNILIINKKRKNGIKFGRPLAFFQQNQKVRINPTQ